MQLFIFLALAFFIISVASGSDLFSGFVAIIAIAGLYFWFSVDILQYFPHSLGGWALLVACYFITGVIWSMFRFYTHYKKEVAELYDRFNIGGRSHDEVWNLVRDNVTHVPYMKGDITTWIGLWPVSVVTYIIGDLLYDISTKIYNCIKSVYERIAKSIIDSMFNKTK